MTTRQLVGIFIDLDILGMLFLYLRFGLKRSARVKEQEGVQEVEVVVKGVYAPNTIEAKKGELLKISFRREEETSCSEYVLIPDFKIRKKLPAFETTVVEITPDKEGEFEFTCAMGMYRGKIVVK